MSKLCQTEPGGFHEQMLTCIVGGPWCSESSPWSVRPASPGSWSIPSRSLTSFWRNPEGPEAAGPSCLSAGPNISAAPPAGPGSLQGHEGANELEWCYTLNVKNSLRCFHILHKSPGERHTWSVLTWTTSNLGNKEWHKNDQLLSKMD